MKTACISLVIFINIEKYILDHLVMFECEIYRKYMYKGKTHP